jgi:hypothetical protein
LNIAYCYSIIQRNNLIVVPSSQEAQFLLDSYFPFDPYRLKNSNMYIDNLFLAWGGGDDDSDDDSVQGDNGTVNVQFSEMDIES